MRYLASVYVDLDHFLITSKDPAKLDESAMFRRTYCIADIGQGRWKNPFKFFLAMVQVLCIFLRERPDFLLSTGCGIAVPGFLIARFFGARTIYVEAGARVCNLSKTGLICYYLSDLFLVQHPAVTKNWPKAVYRGAIFQHLAG